MTIEISRLKLFVQVAELGSLSKAAVQLDSVQSAVSRQVAALEKECGHRLFNRTGRGLTLTDFGEKVFPKVKALLQQADQLERELSGAEESPSGEVRIGMMPSVAELLVATVFKTVCARFPGIKLRVLEGSNGQLDEWVSNGRIDMGVLYRYGNTARPNEDQLFVVESYLVGPPGDPITTKPTVEFSELDGLPLVLPGFPNGLRTTLDKLVARQHQNFNLSVVMEADSLPIQRSMASHGQAYAIHGDIVVSRDVSMGIISAARIINPSIKRTLVLATTSQRPLSLAGRETARILRAVAHDTAGEHAMDSER